MNIWEISKLVRSTLKHQEHYEKKLTELRNEPIVGRDKNDICRAVFDIDSYRIASLECVDIDPTKLTAIQQAVNNAFEQADQAWKKNSVY